RGNGNADPGRLDGRSVDEIVAHVGAVAKREAEPLRQIGQRRQFVVAPLDHVRDAGFPKEHEPQAVCDREALRLGAVRRDADGAIRQDAVHVHGEEADTGPGAQGDSWLLHDIHSVILWITESFDGRNATSSSWAKGTGRSSAPMRRGGALRARADPSVILATISAPYPCVRRPS